MTVAKRAVTNDNRVGVDHSGGGRLDGRHILIVDDDTEFAVSLADMLELEGAIVQIVNSVEGVSDVLGSFQPEACLVDVRIKQADGIQLIDRIHALWPESEVVLMTGFGSMANILEALRKGAFDFLQKPIDPEHLFLALNRAIEHRDLVRERQELFLATQKALKESLKISAAKTRFMRTMNHHFRTPLNAVIAFSDIIRQELMGVVSPPIYRDYAEDIHHSGDELLRNVRRIEKLADLLSGATINQMQPIDLVDLLRCCLGLRQGDFEKQNIELKLLLQEQTLLVDCSSEDTQIVLLELLDNALRFTPAGGWVMITAGRNVDDHVFVELQDSGKGMTEEEMARVIQMFEVAVDPEREVREGLGIGLTLAHAVMIQQQGELRLLSSEQSGVRVKLVFAAPTP
jgi:signal transduction histidine kinase